MELKELDMVEDDSIKLALKAEFFQKVEDLGPQQALFPSQNEPIDQLVRQLEVINPISNPLQSQYLPSLLGKWQLIYASAGTFVTRSLASIPGWEDTIKIKQVWQTLTAGSSKIIAAENIAVLDLPLFGEWRLGAEGVWTWGVNEQVAKVTFSAFSVQATKPFGQSSWSLPELKIPILEFLRNEAQWTTSYLDPELRVGRGATGNVFVFCRAGAVWGDVFSQTLQDSLQGV